MDPIIKFNQKQFGCIFPFHVLMNSDLKILSTGKSMNKVLPDLTGHFFMDCFSPYRPSFISITAQDLRKHTCQMLMLRASNRPNLLFKGQIEKLEDSDQYIFLCNPWFYELEELVDNGLILDDFPYFDNTADLLHVVKTGEIATSDLKELVKTIKKQKEELKRTSADFEHLSRVAGANEKKYRGIIDNMNLGLLEVDMKEEMTYANQSFCSMSGFSLEELIGCNPKELFIRGSDIELIQEKNELRKKGISDAYEVLVTDKKGERRWWLISGAPRYDDNGVLLGTIGIHLDITDQKNLELELIEAREKANRLAKSRELFLANMSHEMRTPMNAIVGMSNQLAKSEMKDHQQSSLHVIRKASANLLMIMNDILDISKIEAGKLAIENIGFDLTAIIKDAIDILRYNAVEKGISLSTSAGNGQASQVLLGDPFRINQVLMNLLSNAIKFTHKGSVHLSIDILEDLPRSQTIEFSISDTGIGMDAYFISQVFDPFRQEENSTSRKFGGTGLGMSISKQLVELMGGAIQVQSEKGVGTTVSFQIVFEKGELEDLPAMEQVSLRPEGLKNRKILIADDNDVNRMIAAKILKDQGCEVFEAADGLEVIEQALLLKPELILMDLQMPVYNGQEATTLLREKGFEAPIIAVTANAMQEAVGASLDAGMNDLIIKPYTEIKLLKKIEQWIYEEIEQAAPQMIDKKETEDIQHMFSLDGLLAIARGDTDFLSRMLKIFIRQTPELVVEMKKALHAEDKEKIAMLAHKMKSSIDNMRIISLKEDIRLLEMSHINNTDLERIGHLIEKLDRVMKDLIPAFQKELEKLEQELVIE